MIRSTRSAVIIGLYKVETTQNANTALRLIINLKTLLVAEELAKAITVGRIAFQ